MKSTYVVGIPLFVGLCVALTSCTPGGRSPSGFLTNYRQLDSGYGTADTLAVYVKPGVDLKQYDSVMIDPVTTVIASPGVSAEVKDQLAAYLSDALRSQAAGELKVVDTPGPRTIRVRTALTDKIEGVDSGEPVTVRHDNPRATLDGKLGSDAVAGFVSSVCFEGEIVDSATGERLSALVDHRIGAKREASPDTSWAAVRSATNVGAAKLWRRFSDARGN